MRSNEIDLKPGARAASTSSSDLCQRSSARFEERPISQHRSIKHLDAQESTRFGKSAGQGDVVRRGLGIPRRMIVREDHAGRRVPYRGAGSVLPPLALALAFAALARRRRGVCAAGAHRGARRHLEAPETRGVQGKAPLLPRREDLPRPGGTGGGQAIPVAVEPATVGSIASYYKATATLEAEKQAEVLARVTGIVAALAAEEGDQVAKGATLLTIGNDEYRLRLERTGQSATELYLTHFGMEEQVVQSGDGGVETTVWVPRRVTIRAR
mgnify:CR=1 FL=1